MVSSRLILAVGRAETERRVAARRRGYLRKIILGIGKECVLVGRWGREVLDGEGKWEEVDAPGRDCVLPATGE